MLLTGTFDTELMAVGVMCEDTEGHMFFLYHFRWWGRDVDYNNYMVLRMLAAVIYLLARVTTFYQPEG